LKSFKRIEKVLEYPHLLSWVYDAAKIQLNYIHKKGLLKEDKNSIGPPEFLAILFIIIFVFIPNSLFVGHNLLINFESINH